MVPLPPPHSMFQNQFPVDDLQRFMRGTIVSVYVEDNAEDFMEHHAPLYFGPLTPVAPASSNTASSTPGAAQPGTSQATPSARPSGPQAIFLLDSIVRIYDSSGGYSALRIEPPADAASYSLPSHIDAVSRDSVNQLLYLFEGAKQIIATQAFQHKKELQDALEERDAEIAKLRAEIKQLQQGAGCASVQRPSGGDSEETEPE